MAPYVENGTARVYLDYTSRGTTHTMMVRIPLGDPTAPEAYADAYGDFIATCLPATDAVTGARYSAQLTNFSLPIAGFVPKPGLQPANGATWVEDADSAFLGFSARGLTAGRRVTHTVFTPVKWGDWPEDNRYSPGENAAVTQLQVAYAALVGPDSDTPAASIAGDLVQPKGYVNTAKNAYWQRAQR